MLSFRECLFKDFGTISTEEANQLGRDVFKITLEWKDEINSAYNAIGKGTKYADVLDKSLHHLLVSCAYHYLELIKIRSSDSDAKLTVPFLSSEADHLLFGGESKKITSKILNKYKIGL